MLKGSIRYSTKQLCFVNDPGGQFSLFGHRKREETTFVSNLMSRDKDGKKIFCFDCNFLSKICFEWIQ